MLCVYIKLLWIFSCKFVYSVNEKFISITMLMISYLFKGKGNIMGYFEVLEEETLKLYEIAKKAR